MKKKISLIILSFLILNFVSAEIIYLSSQKKSGGLMIGAEIFNQKTNSSIKPVGYIYEWRVPDVSLTPQKTPSNIFFFSLPRLNEFFLIDIKVSRPLSKETYFFKNQKIFLAEPKVKIVRKTPEGFILPLSRTIKQQDSLTIITKNFVSKNLTYIWEFNGVFISNEKEISVSNFKEKSGTIRIKVFGTDFRERGEDIKTIQIE
mgnify:CR=1 FL=1